MWLHNQPPKQIRFYPKRKVHEQWVASAGVFVAENLDTGEIRLEPNWIYAKLHIVKRRLRGIYIQTWNLRRLSSITEDNTVLDVIDLLEERDENFCQLEFNDIGIIQRGDYMQSENLDIDLEQDCADAILDTMWNFDLYRHYMATEWLIKYYSGDISIPLFDRWSKRT